MRFERQEKIFFIAIFGLVVLDHLTKILAFYALEPGQYAYVFTEWLFIEEYINPKPLGIILIDNKETLTNGDHWDKLTTMMLIPLLYWVYIASKGIDLRRHQRYLLGFFLIVGYWMLLAPFRIVWETTHVNRLFVLIVVFAIGNIILPMGLFFVRDTYIRIILLLASAGNLGNLISFAYPPYRIVDMIGYEHFIYNFADIYGHLSYLLIWMSPVYVFIVARREKRLNMALMDTKRE
jgi:lipoprotein signal peptidase